MQNYCKILSCRRLCSVHVQSSILCVFVGLSFLTCEDILNCLRHDMVHVDAPAQSLLSTSQSYENVHRSELVTLMMVDDFDMFS